MQARMSHISEQDAGSNASDSSKANWLSARKSVLSHGVTRGFKTLRDMHSVDIVPFGDLELVSTLGEGAFGTVEKRKLVNADGSVTFMAVKRLKNQDVMPELGVLSPRGGNVSLSRVLQKMSSVNEASRHGAENPTEEEQERTNREIDALVGRLSKDDQLFLDEINIMRKLSHPYIIQYIGAGLLEEDGRAYIAVAQECCDGGNISTTIQRAGMGTGKRLYSYLDAHRWCIQVAKALQYLHESRPQVLHRDLKSENLLLTQMGRSGDIRVMDFGLMKLRRIAKVGYRRATENEVELADYQLTGCTGSFTYMAPEVVRSEQYTEKVDIFSFSVIMYELFSMCLVATLAHRSGAPNEFENYAHRVAGGHRETIKKSWPQALQDLIAEGWHHSPQMRPSAREMVARLTDMQGDIEALEAACPRKVIAESAGTNAAGDGGCCVIS